MTTAPRVADTFTDRVLFEGIDCLGDIELLALLLGRGRGPSPLELAATLSTKLGGVDAMARLGPRRLSSEPSVGPTRALRVAAAFELGRRASARSMTARAPVLTRLEHVAAWARPRLADLAYEEVWLLTVDAKNALCSAHRIARGGLHGCSLTARDVLRPAVQNAASAIVLVHNHPSGDPTPSAEDFEMTRRVACASDIVGIPLLDHVVVARGGHTSLRDLGAVVE